MFGALHFITFGLNAICAMTNHRFVVECVNIISKYIFLFTMSPCVLTKDFMFQNCFSFLTQTSLPPYYDRIPFLKEI